MSSVNGSNVPSGDHPRAWMVALRLRWKMIYISIQVELTLSLSPPAVGQLGPGQEGANVVPLSAHAIHNDMLRELP